jgi:hypothetical protein
MAWTEKYVTDAGAGAADGTSLANAWSWATMLTTLAAGQRANVQGAITRTTNTDAFTNAGTATTPIAIRGINATAGDLEANGRTAGGALVTTNFPVVTYTTGGLTIPNGTNCEHVSFTSAKAGATLTAGSFSLLRRCTVANTHASSVSAIGYSYTQTSTATTDCDFSCASSNTSAKALSAAGEITNSLIIGTASGAACFSSSGLFTLTNCMLRGGNAGAVCGSAGEVRNCSFRDITTSYVDNTASNALISLTNNVAWGTNSGANQRWYNSTTSVRPNYQKSNFVGNMAQTDANLGDWYVYNQTTLTADPFTSSTILTLNTTAGGGAAVRAVGYPANLDGGAWQHADSASSGGVTSPAPAIGAEGITVF